MSARNGTRRKVLRLDYQPPAFLAPALELFIELEREATRVTSAFAFHRNPAAPPELANAPLIVDGEGLRDVVVELDGERLPADRFTCDAHALTVHAPPAEGHLRVQATNNPVANAALQGLYVSSGVFCTQCEAEGFRRIGYFLDRPDVLATYTVTIVADRLRYPVLLSNGNRVAEGTLERGRHFVRWHDPFPKPTYLFALVAGDLSALEDRFTTMSGRAVALEIWSTARNLPRCTHAMQALKRAMRWDEERYGLEYDLDRFMIFCADDFNMGAMENKGLNIFNSKLVLADPATATDGDYQAIEGVIGHEYFHNWTGNRVTCRDWFQLSLKEGLTVFRDQEFSADMGSRAVERIAAVDYLRSAQFPEDASPVAHPVRPEEYSEINNFYTPTIYEKGAEVIRMQHTLLGPERFRRGMDLYFERHDGKAVTCDDFVQAMEDASLENSGPDLQQFRRWYSQAGTPVVRATGRYDVAAATYTLDVEQRTAPTRSGAPTQPFHLPLCVGLVGPDGADMPLRLDGDTGPPVTSRVLSVAEAHQQFIFRDVAAAPVPSLLRGFSAPVRLEFDYTEDELAFLAAHDSDAVNRWEASQRSFCNAILALAGAHARGKPMTLPASLAGLAAKIVADRAADPALLALALTPPEPAYLAGLVETIDVDALVAAREFVMREIARAARTVFEQTYALHRPSEPYAPTQAQIGPRMLRNACLNYLAAIDDPRARALAVGQFDAADNMTDTIAALAAVNNSAAADRDALFARFEARWREEPLVLDKWFALQAASLRSDTLARVRSLLAHPKFDARNPNRVRALVATFARRNWHAFHQQDGSGYDFVTDQILAFDRRNPQLASSLTGAFNLWRRFAEPRRALQRSALRKIAGAAELSPDVAEIVERNLADQPS